MVVDEFSVWIPFNRTTVECKSAWVAGVTAGANTFNRTTVECKFKIDDPEHGGVDTFNRTTVECKC